MKKKKKKTDGERKNKNVLIGLILHIPTVSRKKKEKIFLWLPEAHQREDPSSQQWTSHRGDDYHEMWRDA